MDFNNIENEKYYCFGCRFFRNGTIDYKELAEELEEAQYYYAAMMFDCDDIGFNLRMQTYSPSQWIFEADDYDTTEEEFKQFTETKQFKDFAKVVPQRIQAAIGVLSTVDEKELKRNGIKKESVDKIVKSSMRIMTIVNGAFKNPKMKALPKMSDKVKSKKEDEPIGEADDKTKTKKDLIFQFLKGKIDRCYIGHQKPDDRKVGSDAVSTYWMICAAKENEMLVGLNFKNDDLYSVDFYAPGDLEALDPFGTSSNAKLSIYANGGSAVYLLPIIVQVCKTGKYDLSDEQAERIANNVFEESEKLDEAPDKELRQYRNDKREEKRRAKAEWQKKRTQKAKKAYRAIADEYRQIVAAIKSGAETIGDVEVMVKKGVAGKVVPDRSTREVKAEVEEAKNDYGDNPEIAFKEMAVYVKSVIKGLNPGTIICGAPGLGKTYRVLQQLKAAGYKDGENMGLIKGKITATKLYAALYQYKEEGEILVVDDADSILFDPTGINIFKAALDSYDERKIMYNSPVKILDPEGEEIPNEFEYYGSVIVITNFRAGQLDTALKGRVFVQSLDFTTKQVLQIIDNLADKIDPGKLSMEAKKKSIEYLKKMAGNDLDSANDNKTIEISLRTFGMCAKLYQLHMDDEDLDEGLVKMMIKHQMENQTARGGKKF